MLTDTPGVLTADPRLDANASLIEEVIGIDRAFEEQMGGAGSLRGSGGMASKVAAARIASWSGVRAVIAAADRPGVLLDAVAGVGGIGTVVHPHERRLSARKLWIAFAVGALRRRRSRRGGTTSARRRQPLAVARGRDRPRGQRSLPTTRSRWSGPDGVVFAKGLTRMDADALAQVTGRRTSELPEGWPHEVVHRDDLVVLPG